MLAEAGRGMENLGILFVFCLVAELDRLTNCALPRTTEGSPHCNGCSADIEHVAIPKTACLQEGQWPRALQGTMGSGVCGINGWANAF